MRRGDGFFNFGLFLVVFFGFRLFSLSECPLDITDRPQRSIMAEPPENVQTTGRTFSPRIFLLGVIIVGFVAVTFFALRWAFGPVEPQKSVAAQWNEAIRRLGIEPVYPPQEDLAVGDLFALVTADALEDIHQDPLAGRAMKLWHLDLTTDIEDTYKTMYHFPDRPGGKENAMPAADPIFKTGMSRTDLPIVIFPAFTIANVKSAASSGALSRILEGAFGGAANSNATAEIKLSAAETYGIPALVAESRLYAFCKDYSKAPVCTEDGLRQQLSMVVGSKIYEKIKDEKSGKEKFRLEIELALISRVYLARSIETVISRQQAISTRGDIRSGEAVEAEKKPLEVAPSSDSKSALSPTNNSAGDASQQQGASIETLRRLVEAQKAQISALEAKTAGGTPGLSTLVQSGNQSAIRLTETTVRPVVIGFRSVRWLPN